MSNQAFVNFSSLYESGKLDKDLLKELKAVEGTLNLTPTAKDKKTSKYVASPTNISVMQHLDVTVRKISGMVNQGLSYAAEDYYIFVQFGGKPSVTKAPNGIIKAMNKLASRSGYIANINTGCIFKGYESLRVVRDGLKDVLQLINSPESEIGEGAQNDILAPYAVVTLLDKKSSAVISSKVTIIRNGEYLKAKAQGSATHQSYPVPMAEKIALKRAGDQMAASLGIDDSVELEALSREISDHNAEYDINKSPEPSEPEAPKYISAEDVKWIKDTIKKTKTDETSFSKYLAKNRADSIEKITAAFFVDVKKQLENALKKSEVKSA